MSSYKEVTWLSSYPYPPSLLKNQGHIPFVKPPFPLQMEILFHQFWYQVTEKEVTVLPRSNSHPFRKWLTLADERVWWWGSLHRMNGIQNVTFPIPASTCCSRLDAQGASVLGEVITQPSISLLMKHIVFLARRECPSEQTPSDRGPCPGSVIIVAVMSRSCHHWLTREHSHMEGPGALLSLCT